MAAIWENEITPPAGADDPAIMSTRVPSELMPPGRSPQVMVGEVAHCLFCERKHGSCSNTILADPLRARILTTQTAPAEQLVLPFSGQAPQHGLTI